MPIKFRFNALTFSDGTQIDVPAESVLAIVGPNNAGKSAALRDLMFTMTVPPGQPDPRRVLPQVEIERDGTPEDLVEWIAETSFVLARPDGRYFRRSGVGPAPESGLRAEWSNASPYMPSLSPFLAFFAAADQRLALLNPSGPYDPVNDAPSHPMQVLFARPELEQELSETAFEAFGHRLTLSRIWGSTLDLYLGEVGVPASVVPTPEYIGAIQSLPTLQAQGDGMRSFMGLMLALITARFRVVLVDEPEAFLHPPQARLLGRKLATSAPGETQVVVATHSLDVLQGLLDPVDASVAVVRVVRDGHMNRAAVLDPDSLREIWDDPLLRYSNVLEGLFHLGVVLTESDADSRFYAAVLDALRDDADLPPHDLLFTQSGGKHRFPLVIRALRAVDVPIVGIADFDVLREERLLREIVEALGAGWDDVQPHWRRVAAAIEPLGAAPLLSTVRDDLERALSAETGPRLSREGAQRLRSAAKADDGWAWTKAGGLAVLPQGDPTHLARELLSTLSDIGLFVVPVGELERWIPEVGGHGPAWVAEVLKQRRHEDVGLAARGFIDGVTAAFG